MSERLGKAAILPLLLAAANAPEALPAPAPLAAPLEPSPAPLPALEASPAAPAFETIGPYELLRELGSGGMGTVYLAESNDATRRRVALKVIRANRSTPELVARLALEARALAALDHDFVVRLHHTGRDADGRPYLALEAVDGEPITAYCDRRRLDVEARLALFRDVCAAVQHLHERGVLHRDLKPANILVRELDGRPVPKLIDLGLAHLEGDGLEDELGGVIGGTPAWMAPEQFVLGVHELDARCDVFALGLVLRELLAGTRPSAGKLELGHNAVHVPRPRPSAELAALGAEATRVAAARGTHPARLRRRLAGALDAIVQRACAGDREERTASAAALAGETARDVERRVSRRRACARLALAAAAAGLGFLGGWLVAGG